jgi:predicted lipoprotein with Yx(FWY)xxD motif
MRRPLVPALVLLLVLTAASAVRGNAATRAETSMLPPAKTITVSGFGKVLATRKGQALYYFTPEKRSPGKIFCTGSCAAAWPVLYVAKGETIEKHYPGFMGTWGTVRRPNGRLQVTYNRLPLYSYAHEPPKVVRCNNVNGWFVVRVR